MLRFFPAMVLVLGCGGIGICLSNGLKRRVVQLEQLEQILRYISFHIDFLALPLSLAIKKSLSDKKSIWYPFFSQVCLGMSQPEKTVEAAVRAAMAQEKQNLSLYEEDWQILMDLFCHIGKGDRQTSMDQIRITCAKLQLAVEQGRAKTEKDGKMVRGLGFLAGIFMVLLLM